MLCAADVNGVWKAEYTSPDGNQRQSTFHLKADGEKLTGKVVTGTGEVDIQNGTVHGDNVSFSIVRNFGGNDVTFKYTGKVTGNEIKFNVSFAEDRSIDIVARRQTT